MTNTDLAARAAAIARQYAPRTPQRRAGAALHSALVTTGTPGAARRALAFTDPVTAAAARELLDELDQIEKETTP